MRMLLSLRRLDDREKDGSGAQVESWIRERFLIMKGVTLGGATTRLPSTSPTATEDGLVEASAVTVTVVTPCYQLAKAQS